MTLAGLRQRSASQLRAAFAAPWGALRWGVLAAGVALSMLGASLLERQARHEANLAFRLVAVDKVADIESGLRAYSDVLHATRGLFDAAPAVSREQFHAFAEALNLPQRYPGLASISFAPLLARAQVKRFEEAVHAETGLLTRGLPPFAIRPLGDQGEVVVLHYIEPLANHLEGWGLDLLAQPQRRLAVEHARDTGGISATAGIVLHRDGGTQLKSALFRLAIYRGGGVPATVAQRRLQFVGVAGFTIRMDEFVHAMFTPEALGQVRLRIRTIASPAGPAAGSLQGDLLYDSQAATAGPSTEDAASAVQASFAVGDQRWEVTMLPRGDLVGTAGRVWVFAALAAMLGASGLLFWLVTACAQVRERNGELGRLNREAALLARFTEHLQSCTSVQEASRLLAAEMPGLLPGSAGALYLFDTHRAGVKTVVRWGSAGGLSEAFALRDCQALRRGMAHCVGADPGEPDCHHFTGPPPPAYCCLPLYFQGEWNGMLHVQPAAGGSHLRAEVELTKVVGRQFSLALASLGLRERLMEQATHDKLTGLYNRYYMAEWFEQELQRARRNQQTIGVIMLDIDHFKRVNDEFGHDAGDMALRTIAEVLRRHARRSDVVCRFGGEEFLVLMPESTAAGTQAKARQLLALVEGLALNHDDHPIGTLTLSAGVAMYPDDATTVDELLRLSDDALYAAKHAGRNQVVVAGARRTAGEDDVRGTQPLHHP